MSRIRNHEDVPYCTAPTHKWISERRDDGTIACWSHGTEYDYEQTCANCGVVVTVSWDVLKNPETHVRYAITS